MHIDEELRKKEIRHLEKELGEKKEVDRLWKRLKKEIPLRIQ